jgi:carboxyl-terminal processing protease
MFTQRTRVILITAIVTLSIFFLLERRFLTGVTARGVAPKGLELLARVVQLIKYDYLEEKDPAQTMDGAYKGMANSLDALSGYLDKDDVVKYSQQKEKRLNETGILLYKRAGTFPLVTGVVENSPADKKGLKAGDYLSTIDNRSTLLMSQVESTLALKGKDAAPVKVRVLRENSTLDLTIDRARLFEGPISYRAAEGTSGILKVHYLLPPCAGEIKKAVGPHFKTGKGPLVLDFTDCAEGDLEEGRKLINLFLKADAIGFMEKKAGAKVPFACADAPAFKDVPVSVWVNQATMGPAEAVAGVLQEFKRAKVVGLPTVGAVAQLDFFPLGDGSGLVLTSGIFHLNSGPKLFGEGVKPDITLEAGDQSPATFLKKTLSPPTHP